uniref:Uncharacterized protein n=1 Tax=Anopheles atroparvus TaxID=41427 RepID=A0A182IXE2_ANOAO
MLLIVCCTSRRTEVKYSSWCLTYSFTRSAMFSSSASSSYMHDSYRSRSFSSFVCSSSWSSFSWMIFAQQTHECCSGADESVSDGWVVQLTSYFCLDASYSCWHLVTTRFCFWIGPKCVSISLLSFWLTEFSTFISLLTISVAISFSTRAEAKRKGEVRRRFSRTTASCGWPADTFVAIRLFRFCRMSLYRSTSRSISCSPSAFFSALLDLRKERAEWRKGLMNTREGHSYSTFKVHRAM